MRSVYPICVVALAILAVGVMHARADHLPAIVVPGKPGVPVIINGYDASYGVVYGDWGLYRPGAMAPIVVYNPYVNPYAAPSSPAAHYFPSTGHRPRVGRLEKEPPANRPLPPPAESYHRQWGVQSQPGPVTEYPPFDPPPVIVAPNVGRRGGHAPHGPQHKGP